MDTGVSPARQARAYYRHDLRTLTYVTLDQANGGIIRNLTHDGIGVQVVAAVRPRQQLRLRFELRYPKLRVETRGEVMWATFSGQCGIRFLDLSPRLVRQIDEWIFGSLLEGGALHSERTESMFAQSGPVLLTMSGADAAEEEEDGLMISAAPQSVIELPVRPIEAEPEGSLEGAADSHPLLSELDWLSQPLTGRSLTWTVNGLVVFAAQLLFALIFLSVTREPPKWPLAMSAGGAVMVAALYWGFFKIFGGVSPGTRLARLADAELEQTEEARDTRFR
jgi:PilZ domain